MQEMMAVLARNRVHLAAEKQAAQDLAPGAPATTNPAVVVNNPGLSILSAMQCSDSHAHVHGTHALHSMCSLQVSCRWLCVLQQLCHHLYVSTECMSLCQGAVHDS